MSARCCFQSFIAGAAAFEHRLLFLEPLLALRQRGGHLLVGPLRLAAGGVQPLVATDRLGVPLLVARTLEPGLLEDLLPLGDADVALALARRSASTCAAQWAIPVFASPSTSSAARTRSRQSLSALRAAELAGFLSLGVELCRRRRRRSRWERSRRSGRGWVRRRWRRQRQRSGSALRSSRPARTARPRRSRRRAARPPGQAGSPPETGAPSPCVPVTTSPPKKSVRPAQSTRELVPQRPLPGFRFGQERLSLEPGSRRAGRRTRRRACSAHSRQPAARSRSSGSSANPAATSWLARSEESSRSAQVSDHQRQVLVGAEAPGRGG